MRWQRARPTAPRVHGNLGAVFARDRSDAGGIEPVSHPVAPSGKGSLVRQEHGAHGASRLKDQNDDEIK